jgi:hypothetical protein
LEIPFFVGVLNENDKRLSFYSGENLPAFFPFVGPFKTLTVKLLERSQITDPHDPMVPRRDHYTVMFPRLLSITIDSTREELNRNVDVLQEMCSLMQRNISTNKIQEYIFEGYDGHSFRILAGPGSAQTFRNNFVKRLAESFYNLSWIYTNNPHTKEAIIEEFNIYEATFINMKNLYPTSTEFLIASKFYEELKKILFDNTKA